MLFSCRHMVKGGWRGEDGREPICHLLASLRNKQHVMECFAHVLLTILSTSRERHTQESNTNQKRKGNEWDRGRIRIITRDRHRAELRKKTGSLVGMSERGLKLIPVERSRRAL